MSTATRYNCAPNNPYHGYREHIRPKTGKLRSSCDFCALSKVKCDRGQPQCSRCIRNEVSCRYSPTRRSAKARHIYSIEQQQSSTVGDTDKGPSLEHDTSTQSYSLVHDVLNTTTSDTTSTSTTTSSPTDFLKQLPMALFERTSLMPSPSLEASSGVIFPNNESPDHPRRTPVQWDPEYRNQRPDDQFTPLSLVDLGGTSSSSCLRRDITTHPSPIPRADADDCMRRVLSALSGLHVSAECRLHHEHAVCHDHSLPRSLDATLTANRSAMDKIRLVLSCSCSKTSNIFLLIASATQQVLESYYTLTKTQLFLLSPPMVGKESLDGAAGSQDAATSWAENVPVAIGSYIVDGEARGKAILQVLQAETNALGDLIDSLVSLSTQAAPKETAGNMCGTFIGSLQTLYRETVQSLYL